MEALPAHFDQGVLRRGHQVKSGKGILQKEQAYGPLNGNATRRADLDTPTRVYCEAALTDAAAPGEKGGRRASPVPDPHGEFDSGGWPRSPYENGGPPSGSPPLILDPPRRAETAVPGFPLPANPQRRSGGEERSCRIDGRISSGVDDVSTIRGDMIPVVIASRKDYRAAGKQVPARMAAAILSFFTPAFRAASWWATVTFLMNNAPVFI